VGGVAIGIVALTISAAGAPLFLSSAGSASLAKDLANVNRSFAGLSTSLDLTFPTVRLAHLQSVAAGPLIKTRRLLDVQSASMLEYSSRLPDLDRPIQSLVGPAVTVSGASNAVTVDARPVARSRFGSHLTAIDAVDGRGVWLPASAAETLQVEPGDTIELAGERATKTRLKGTYAALTATSPLPAFWAPFRKFIVPPTDEPGPGSELQVLLLGDEPTVGRIAGQMRWRMTASWELPIATRDLTLPEARRSSARILRLADRIPTATFTGENALFGGARFFEVAGDRYIERLRPTSTTALPEITRAASRTVQSITPPVHAVAIIAATVAMLVVAAAGFYCVQKRAVEFRLLVSRGIPTSALGVHAALEALLPAAATCAVALVMARYVLARAGPGPIDSTAFRQAIVNSAALVMLGVIAFSIVVALSAERLLAFGSRKLRWRRAYSDVGLAVGVAASFLVMANRATETAQGGRIDVFLVLLPLAAVGLGAALLARYAMHGLKRARAATETAPFPIYIALRRLAGGSNAAVALIAVSAVAVGLLIYTSMVVASANATTHAKSHVFVGSDVSVYANDPNYVPDLGVPATTVVKVDDMTAGGRQVDVLGIDPETFAAAAYWDDAFSKSSLEDLVTNLRTRPRNGLSVVVAGGSDTIGALTTDEGSVKLRVVGTASVFPGMLQDDPLLVADKQALLRYLDSGSLNPGPYVWAKGRPGEVVATMAREGLAAEYALTARDAGASPTLQSLAWTLSVLRVFGIALGGLAIGVFLLYLSARQRTRVAAYVLMRRMGLSSRAHRVALASEIALTLCGSVAFGIGLGAASAGIVHTAIDLLPQVPPSPLLRFPSADATASLLAAIVVAGAGGLWLQVVSDRANPAEVMRARE
jgi:putative ABC transport system permease protein